MCLIEFVWFFEIIFHTEVFMSRGGKRNNAGAPKGTVQRRTLEKKAVARALRERTMLQAGNWFDALDRLTPRQPACSQI